MFEDETRPTSVLEKRHGGIPNPARPPATVTSQVLLGMAGELVIEHAGREYRLRLTRNGKLILTA